MRFSLITLTIFLISMPAYAKYSGGRGEPNDPYQIATAEDLMLLGESPEDNGKHLILTADIDLDPDLPGRKVFDRAVIGPYTYDVAEGWQGMPFTGVFDGNGKKIYNFSYTSTDRDYVGLFGFVDDPNAQIINLGLVNPDIEAGTGEFVGSLVGLLKTGRIVGCYVEDGSVSGKSIIGGLIGENTGTVDGCYSTCNVTGERVVGGLVGQNGFIFGWSMIMYSGTISNCYSTGSTSGNESVGGLVGIYYVGTTTNCYATGKVLGNKYVGGLVGTEVFGLGEVEACFWDTQTSDQTTSIGGTGLTTAELQTVSTFLDAGWDFVDEIENGTEDIWKMWDGYDYSRLIWESGPNPPLVFVDINDPNFYGQMSRYEVTNAQYCDFLNAALATGDITIGSADNPRWHGYYAIGASGSNPGTDYAGELYYNGDGSGWSGLDGETNGGAARIRYSAGAFYVDSGFSNHPVTEVSWYGATAFANYYGYYLPTEEQWQGVADYDGTYLYGCGTIIDNSKANTRGSTHPFGTTAVGSFGQYGYGMSDMAGNVREWTSTSSGSSRVLRDGCWFFSDSLCTVSVRQACGPGWRDGHIGFRVCR